LTSILAFAAPGGLPAGLGTFILPIGLLVVLYLLMIRPQQKRQQKWQQMLNSLKPGDRVTTTGGIRGIILSIKDDALQLRVAPDNLRIEVAKNAIASVTQDDAK
jgi:preprotein translocase subunit YajC